MGKPHSGCNRLGCGLLAIRGLRIGRLVSLSNHRIVKIQFFCSENGVKCKFLDVWRMYCIRWRASVRLSRTEGIRILADVAYISSGHKGRIKRGMNKLGSKCISKITKNAKILHFV